MISDGLYEKYPLPVQRMADYDPIISHLFIYRETLYKQLELSSIKVSNVMEDSRKRIDG